MGLFCTIVYSVFYYEKFIASSSSLDIPLMEIKVINPQCSGLIIKFLYVVECQFWIDVNSHIIYCKSYAFWLDI